MIEVKVSISDIDYESAFDALWPVLCEYLEKSEDKSWAASVLSKTKGASGAVAKTALKLLPQDKKEELVKIGLTHYQKNIVDFIMEQAKQRSISLQVQGIEIQTQPDKKA